MVGVLVYQMPLDNIKAILYNRTGLGETGETVLLNREGLLLVDSKMTEENDALKVTLRSPLISQSTGDRIATGELAGYRDMTSAAALARIKFDGVDWGIAALVDRDEALAGVATMRKWILGVAIVIFVVALLVSILFARSITRPIDRIVVRMNQLTSGKTDFDLSQDIGDDEIGQIAKSLDVFRNAAIEKVRLEGEAADARAAREAEKAEEARQAQDAITVLGDGLDRIARGDMSCQLDTPLASHFEQLRLDFNKAVGRLRDTLQAVKSNTNNMVSGTRQISSGSQDLAGLTERNASNLERTASALSDIMEMVKKTAEGAQQTQTTVSTAKSDAEQGGQVALNAIDAMSRIEKTSGEISQIVSVIDEIAFQTNLLALNAGVEAARAGEAGRGFAVVASEVRALAQRSAEAAKSIKELISASSSEVSNGVQLVGQTGEALDRIVGKVTEIDEVVTSIAADAQEQADDLQRINDAVNQMDQATQQTAAMAEETTAACRSLSGEGDQLAAVVSQFEIGATRSDDDRMRAELNQIAPHLRDALPENRNASGSLRLAM